MLSSQRKNQRFHPWGLKLVKNMYQIKLDDNAMTNNYEKYYRDVKRTIMELLKICF